MTGYPQPGPIHPGGPMSEAEYLELEHTSTNARYEYIGGVAKLMAGGTIEADRIGYNCRVALDQHFRSGPCTVFGPDVKVLVEAATGNTNEYYYPDCTLSCDVSDRRRGNRLIRSPRIVFEVLSPGTEKDDRGIKLRNYQVLDTMQQIVLVSQFAPHAEVHSRESEESTTWTRAIYGPGEMVRLDCVDVEIGVDELYSGINFDEPLLEE
jgi:Uma2 family endonuclease